MKASDPGVAWSLRIGESEFAVGEPISIGATLDPNAHAPGLFGAPPAREEPLRVGSFEGSVARGAPVNVSTLSLTPHCHGTHTESARHLSDAQPFVSEVLSPGPLLAMLVTIVPESAGSQSVELPAGGLPGDQIVTASLLRERLPAAPPSELGALVIRTGYDPASHGSGGRDGEMPPYLTPEAAGVVRSLGVRNLVIDVPSIDRLEDGGRLAAHRRFWDLESAVPEHRTITELARVPAHVPDGIYALVLHAPSIRTDAVPSAPVLFPLSPIDK